MLISRCRLNKFRFYVILSVSKLADYTRQIQPLTFEVDLLVKFTKTEEYFIVKIRIQILNDQEAKRPLGSTMRGYEDLKVSSQIV